MSKQPPFNSYFTSIGSKPLEATHSIPIRPHPHNMEIARNLLRSARPKKEERIWDERPLIDQLHEATFTNPVGLQWVKDKYKLRRLLREAHRFVLDDVTSTLVADFSVAIAPDLESVRRIAIPPFPVTWIDLNNAKRIGRMKEMGYQLTPSAAGELDGPVCERVGWLIYPGSARDSYYARYVTQTSEGIISAPMPYWWHTIEPNPAGSTTNYDAAHKEMMALTFGVASNVHPFDACLGPKEDDVKLDSDVMRLMQEIAGELRHIWGFLVALGCGHLDSKITPQATHNDIRKMPNGKPLLPLEHKILHLHLAKKQTASTVVTRTITDHKMRWHEVRSHIRTLKSGKLIKVKSHERGDKTLGRIVKTYKVEK
jgi:hypothetical protein